MFQVVLPEGGAGAGTGVRPSWAGLRAETYALSRWYGHLFTKTAMSIAAIRCSGSCAAWVRAAVAASVDSGAASQPVTVTGPPGAAGAVAASVQPRLTTTTVPSASFSGVMT